MTTAAQTRPLMSRSQYLTIGAAASVTQALMMIPGYNEDGDFELGAWLGTLGFAVVVALLIFSFVVPKGGATPGVVLGVVALISVLVFWAMMTLALAAAAGLVGWRARQRAESPRLANAALTLALVAAIAVIAIIVGDAAAN